MSSITEVWPDWEMAEVIGIGGWSRVYRAVYRGHPEIQAAVKMIPVPDAEAEQILRGAQRMQQLSGKPGIVRIEDAAILPEEDGQSTVMIRMELLRPLRSYLSDKILSESEVLRMGIELCRGLEACHVQGIVHGDIKPDNILVREMPGQDACSVWETLAQPESRSRRRRMNRTTMRAVRKSGWNAHRNTWHRSSWTESRMPGRIFIRWA